MRKIIVLELLFLLVGLCTFSQVQISSILLDSSIYVNDIDFLNQDTVMFSSGSKIYRTQNGGNTWDTIETNFPIVKNIDFIDFNHGVAVSHSSGIKRTNDGGATWSLLSFLPPSNNWDCHMIDTNHFIVSTDSGYIRHIYSNYYVDDTLIDPLALGYPVVIFDFDFLDGNEGFGGGEVNGFSALIHTIDNGLTWDTRASSGFLNLYFNEVSFFNPLIGAAVEFGPGSFERIVVTNDGGYSWQTSSFFSFSKVTSIDFNENGNGLAIAGGYIFITNDAGQTWDTAYSYQNGGPDGSKVKIVNDSVAYLGGWGGIYKITNFATSIKENNINNNSLSIYPSPSNGKFTISFEKKTKKSKAIYIYSTTSELIYKKENIIDNILQVDLSKAAKGVYFVKVIEQNNVMVGKVVVE
ncbi:MAG: T9SS type A sorting domain-containing protein [Bacteroidetes bacterium]|nr:T9SS type A sorting domain-containing protein [Bacteroidota bacterium]MBL0053517.1 T9SS type A sorting domain-containing protein [Bacteroidota bacterium]